MKFHLRVKNIQGRLGCISNVERLPSFQLETPNILLYTKGGCVPHLTYDVLQMLTTECFPAQISLSTTHHAYSAIQNFKKGLGSFIGMPEYLSYCVIQDPIDGWIAYRQNSVCLVTRSGRQFILKDKYMEIMETHSPDMYISMSDGGTDPLSGYRRISNSYNTTVDAFEYCFDRHSSSTILKNKGLIAPVVGGYDMEFREKCAKFMSSFAVLGYFIDGLYTTGLSSTKIPHNKIEDILSFTLSHLPVDKLKIVHGPWSPILVLKMVKLGIDLFDTSFPTIAAENGFALTFDYSVNMVIGDKINDCWKFDNNISETKKRKKENSDELKTQATDEKKDWKDIMMECPYVTNLCDKKFFDDSSPVYENCNCLCCQKYTKAYIYHLHDTNELLGPVLLMLHNLHHYIKFFEKIRETIHKSSLQNQQMACK